MAFSGTAVVTAVGKDVIRITGLSLALAAAGTISNTGGGGDAVLPSTFLTLTGNESKVLISVNQIAAGAVTPLIWANAGGTITVTNTDGANATGGLIITITIPQTRIV